MRSPDPSDLGIRVYSCHTHSVAEEHVMSTDAPTSDPSSIFSQLRRAFAFLFYHKTHGHTFTIKSGSSNMIK